MQNNIRTLRENLKLTQNEFSKMLNIPVKSIRNWEQGLREPSSYVFDLITDVALRKQTEKSINNIEDKVLSFLTIKEKVKSVVSNYNIDEVYLYGSYAKGNASALSDIDLYMISNIDNLDYFGVIEDLRNILNKKIDLLSNRTVKEDSNIINEIKRTGILIYER